jgi:hypothetical protein
MTVFSLLRPGGRFVQSLVFVVGRRGNPTGVAGLGVIHFARFTVIRELHHHGQPRDYLRQPLQLFESNYNGSFGSYIDLFVRLIPNRIRAFWGTSYGFPCRLPLGPFKGYILANQYPVDHYYARYPEASVAIVRSALQIMQANIELRQDGPDMDADAFAQRLRQLVTSVQGDL